LTVNRKSIVPDSTQPDLMTQKAYARSRGHDPSLLTRWKSKGRLVMVGRLVDAAATDARLRETADPNRAGVVRTKAARIAGTDMDEIRRQRARREKSAADEAELRMAVKRRELVDVYGVRLACAATASEITQALDPIPGKIGAQMAAEFGVPAPAMFRLLENALFEYRETVANRMAVLAAKYPEPQTEGEK
jgi:hypothetical protein